MPLSDWMIYGANGYTGELMAREAVRRGLRPVLAGRSAARIEALAHELDLPCRVFSLERPAVVTEQLQGMRLVMLTAGPFSATSMPMAQACIAAGAHYLDITGEIDVFERLHDLDEAARGAGVVLCPGVGFDVIPTDCVAAALKAALPDATSLALGFDTTLRMSPGTLKTTLETAPHGGRVRRGGQLVAVPLAHHVRRIDFGRGERSAMAMPWGDVSTAFHSTGIPDITVYVANPLPAILGAKLMNLWRPLLARPGVQAALARWVDRHVKGPDERARADMPCYVWGEAVNARGERRTARLRTANGYTFTVPGALAVATHLLDDQVSRPGGFYTPSKLLGADLVSRIPEGGSITIS